MKNLYRGIAKIINAQPTSDGDGVRIRRALTPGRIASFDPFLLLDEILSDEAADYIGGFPEHPHRGFETVTYMLDGAMEHRDHLGNTGKLTPGSVQWMTAGRGIIHSEMPQQTEGLLHGFQLWVNLPASEKMCEPAYQEYAAEQIPTVLLAGGNQLKVIAGSYRVGSQTIVGPVQGISTAPDYFDLRLHSDTPVEIAIDPDKTAILYVYQNSVSVLAEHTAEHRLHGGQLGLFNTGAIIKLQGRHTPARALLIAGLPLNEPVAHWGPFVMNTHDQVEQAIRDYQKGALTSAQPFSQRQNP